MNSSLAWETDSWVPETLETALTLKHCDQIEKLRTISDKRLKKVVINDDVSTFS